MQIFKHIHSYAAVLLLGIIFAGCTKDARAPKPATAVTTTTPTRTDDMVLTPAGLMPKANVHFVEPGTELRVSGDGRLQKVESATGNMLQDFGPVTITQDPIHSNGFSRALDNVVPRAVNGWAAYTYWSNPTATKPVTSFTTTWTVPAAPSTQGTQTIFLFNGMQDGTTASSYIIQPVLQWGPSAAGGGKYWAITNWYVSSAHAFYGTLETVTAGNSLTGVMTETGTTGSNYNYKSVFNGYPSASSITASNVPQAFWLAETLEVYGVSKAGQYPHATSMAFSGIDILEGTTNPSITWTPVAATGSALPKAVVTNGSSSDGTVTIEF
jgi:hypothetical protein